MIELNLTEDEFSTLKDIMDTLTEFGEATYGNFDRNHLIGIAHSIETASRPKNYTSENKPRIKQ